jgi:excisionase family DNA binding protein
VAYNPKIMNANKNNRDKRRMRIRMQAEITREWLTYKQAEELTGLSRTTLWKLISASDLEAARVGRAVRINRQSLNAYMKRSAGGPGEVGNE